MEFSIPKFSGVTSKPFKMSTVEVTLKTGTKVNAIDGLSYCSECLTLVDTTKERSAFGVQETRT